MRCSGCWRQISWWQEDRLVDKQVFHTQCALSYLRGSNDAWSEFIKILKESPEQREGQLQTLAAQMRDQL